MIEPAEDMWEIRSAPSDVVIESADPSRVTYIFAKGVETAGGHRIILASSLPGSSTEYLFTAVQQSTISPGRSYFDVLCCDGSASASSTAAGGQTRLRLHLRDEFKNAIAAADIQRQHYVISYANTKTVITGD